MGLIQDFIRKRREKKQHFQQMQLQDQMEETLEERKMSNDERLYLEFKEEDRQKRIKEIVKKIKKQKDREFWSGKKHNSLYADNMFKETNNIFKNQQSIMENDKKQLKGKNIFTNNKNIFKKKLNYRRLKK